MLYSYDKNNRWIIRIQLRYTLLHFTTRKLKYTLPRYTCPTADLFCAINAANYKIYELSYQYVKMIVFNDKSFY